MAKDILSADKVRKLASLANLEVDSSELAPLSKQLSETIEYVENLQDLKLPSLEEATSQEGSHLQYTFCDGEENERNLTQEEALSNAKRTRNGYFVVPRII